MVVHIFGNLVNLKPLKDICKERNIDTREQKVWDPIIKNPK